MAKIFQSMDRLIGGTPMLELCNIERKFDLKAKIVAKLEFFNPTGSVKDRAAAAMIDDAEARGALKKGGTIIEPTSGNTGIGLSAIAASRGYRAIIVMPSSMSVERVKIMKAYGAEMVLSDGTKGMRGAIEEAKRLAATIENSFIPLQFDNPANARAHYASTGPEIWRDTDGDVEAFVAGVGTGGTITGVGRYLKEQSPHVRVVAVEPARSPMLSKGVAGKHGIQGIGAGFVPSVLDMSVVDEVIAVDDEDALAMQKELGSCEGVFVGISSGAAVSAAIRLAKRDEYDGKTIVVLLPDAGEKYLSILQ